jgi:hypothetical protein
MSASATQNIGSKKDWRNTLKITTAATNDAAPFLPMIG